MNYTSFIKMVDQIAGEGEAGPLRAFIHEIARTLPADTREGFLKSLKENCLRYDLDPELGEEDTELDEEVEEILSAIKEMAEEGLTLNSKVNEDWDVWRDFEEDKILFVDTYGILDTLLEAINLLQRCVDKERFESGEKLCKALSAVRVGVEGVIQGEELGIKELISRGLIKAEFTKVLANTLYLTYMGNVPKESPSQEGGSRKKASGPVPTAPASKEQAQEMLKILESFQEDFLTLENVLQVGRREIDLDSFLPFWIQVLAEKRGDRFDTLLLEAQRMLPKQSLVLQNVQLYAKDHPLLYKDLLSQGAEDISPQELLQIGEEGLRQVPPPNPIRRDIALLTAKNALLLGWQEKAEEGWLEAFRTLPDLTGYLRLRLLSQCWEKHAGQVRNLYDDYYQWQSPAASAPLTAMMFFDGRFEELMEGFMETPRIQARTPILQALMLMYLYVGEERPLGLDALSQLIVRSCLFQEKDYCQGTLLTGKTTDSERFWQCTGQWKSSLPLPEETALLWLDRLQQWTKLLVSNMLRGNSRGEYETCAAYIAALEEVLASRGEQAQKEPILQRYQIDYPHRMAFYVELRRFGLL